MALVAIPEMNIKPDPLRNVKSVEEYKDPSILNYISNLLSGPQMSNALRGGLDPFIGKEPATVLVPMPEPAPNVPNKTNPSLLTNSVVTQGQLNATSQNAAADRTMPEAAKVNQAANGMSGEDLSKILGGLSEPMTQKSFTPFSMGQVQINSRPQSFLGRI